MNVNPNMARLPIAACGESGWEVTGEEVPALRRATAVLGQVDPSLPSIMIPLLQVKKTVLQRVKNTCWLLVMVFRHKKVINDAASCVKRVLN